MGNALEAVLRLKEQETQAEQNRSDSLARAMELFQRARQQEQVNQLAQLQMKAGLAEKGLIIDPSSPNGFKRDTSLMSPLEQLIQNGQAADANNKIIAGGGKGVNLFGTGGTQQIGGAIGQVIGQPTAPMQPSSGQGVISDQTLNIAGVPISTKVDYPAADAAKAAATDMAKEQTAANTTASRDTAQFQMVAQGIKNLNELHKNLVNKGFAGDMYRGALSENLDKLPVEVQKKFPGLTTDVQKDIGKFVSGRNELLVKVQPILSQQFGQAGSVRIMESLVNLSKQEFGGLGTPRAQYEGQAEGTLGSLYRIKIASDKYLEELKKSGNPIPPNTPEGEAEVARGISANMSDLSPEQEKQLRDIVSNTLGKKESLPNGVSESDIEHTLKLHPEITREQLLKKLGK